MRSDRGLQALLGLVLQIDELVASDHVVGGQDLAQLAL